MPRFTVTCELAGGSFTLGWVDTLQEALSLVSSCGQRTTIYDRIKRIYLDSNNGFWCNTISGARL